MNQYQKLLFPYAYNILGSAEDAKDAVQEAMSRYISQPRTNVKNEKNYLIKTVINCAIKMKMKYEKEIAGTESWLPEPIVTDDTDRSFNALEVAPFSLLVQLERLSPKERAVFILREGFSYSHDEIAQVLSGTAESSRKLLSRAKEKLACNITPSYQQYQSKAATAIVEKLLQAIQNEDSKAVEKILAEDVQFQADGGKHIQVVAKHGKGRMEVLDILIKVQQKFNKGLQVVSALVNHQPALLFFSNKRLASCQVFEIREKKISRIHTIINPEKLMTLASQVSKT